MPGPVVVAEARDPLQAGIWIDALARAGISATSFERGVGAALGGASAPGWSVYPVVVSRDHLVDARNVIAELDGAAFLAPLSDSSAAAARQRRAIIVIGAVVAGILALALLAAVFSG